MLNRYTLPLISALVVAASLASCQRKAEEPVVSPGAGRGQVWFEVSERPMGGETKATPATIETFTTSHESFGVVGYAYASTSPSTKTKDVSGTMEVSYVIDRDRWEPENPVKYSFAGNLLEFYAWYPYTVPVTAPATINNTTYPTITYTLPEAVADQKDLLVAKASDVTDSPTGDGRVELTFSHMLTAVKFSIGVGTTCSSITLSGIPGTGTLDMNSGEWSPVGTADSTYTINSPTFGDPDDNGQCLIDEEFTLMLIPHTLPASATLTAETPAGTITASLAGRVWKPGKEVTYKIPDPVPSFTVSSTGDKVRFSPGNLQYRASTGTWRFAEHQWDSVGDATKGNVYEYEGGTKCNNASIGPTYSGWIDLFGWGTSGHSFESGYGIAYQPWSTSDYSNDYGPTDGTSGLTGDYALGDWGVKNMGSGWRTLTSAEWRWLLGSSSNASPNPGTTCRTSSTINGTANARFAKAYLFGTTHGLIIFPDVYTHPDDVTPPTGINAAGNTSWSGNQYDATDWAKMESAGCVFLPAAGHREGTSVYSADSYGYYWSSVAYQLRFDSTYVFPDYNFSPKSSGCSVRLVQDL